MKCWEHHLISRGGIAFEVVLHETLTVTTCSQPCEGERLYFIPLTVIMKATEEGNGNDRWLTSSERELMEMRVFLKLCKEGGPLLQTPSKAVGCWQSPPVPCCWGKPLLILGVKGHFCCANAVSGQHWPWPLWFPEEHSFFLLEAPGMALRWPAQRVLRLTTPKPPCLLALLKSQLTAVKMKANVNENLFT